MTAATSTFEEEVAAGKRFQFGKNWAQFLELLNEERISKAERSLLDLLGVESLEGKSFLDIGSGSGLFSLAARRLGAEVRSLDFDPNSVACTVALRDRFFFNDPQWQVLRGSVLDQALLGSLPRFDVVYSWGVLHHTGNMRQAIANTLDRVADNGLLYLALYRKTWLCPFWKVEKRAYCASPPPLQRLVRGVFGATLGVAYRIKNPGREPPRGMDFERDVHDWLGGYPYESITPRDLKALIEKRGFVLRKQVIKTEGIHLTPGCDEFVFQRDALS